MEFITSLQNPLVKRLVKLRTNQDFRKEEGTVLVEGVKMVNEICQMSSPITLIVSHPEMIPEALKSFPIQTVSEEVMQKISGTQNPEGILAEVSYPQPKKFKKLKKLLILDKINDPGNLGTLLRTALAFAWEGIFLVKGGCDPFNDKALRASKGALFRLPYFEGHWSDAVKMIQEFSLEALAADLVGTPVNELKLPYGVALTLGNESHGLSEDAKKHCAPVTIPMQGKMESLNVAVAGGILMYTLAGEIK